MEYTIHIDPRAIEDAQDAIDYYDEQQIGLGEKFEEELNRHIQLLVKHPYFNIRYDNVRCLPLKKFPFLIHFTVEEHEMQIIIRAIFHTSINPESWKARK